MSLRNIPRYTSKIPPELFNKVLLEYLPLVSYCANKFYRRYHFTMPYDDIKSEGVIGLIDAIKKFDGKSSSLRTYADLKITWQIIEYFRTDRFSWRNKLEKAQLKCQVINGRLPTIEELSSDLNISKSSILSLLINTNFYGESDISTHEIEEAQRKLDPYEILARREIVNDLDMLSDREQRIIRLRFFEDMSTGSIGKLFGITAQAIDNVIRIAIAKLRRISTTRENMYRRKINDKERKDIIEDLIKRKEEDIVRLRQDEITLDYRMRKDWIKSWSSRD